VWNIAEQVRTVRTRRYKIKLSPSLDSLVDILACSVGVMIFVVIFAVLEAESIKYAFNPKAAPPPDEKRRVLFVCERHCVRPFEIGPAIEELVPNLNSISFESVRSVVSTANQKNIRDGYFKYELQADEWESVDIQGVPHTYRSIHVLATPLDSTMRADTTQQADLSDFTRFVSSLDSRSVWFCFLLDKDALPLFEIASKKATELGFSIGWDPYHVDWPLRQCIAGCGLADNESIVPDIADRIQNWIQN